WPHGQDRHLAAVLLLHPQRLLDGHLVVAAHGLLGHRAVEASIGQERLLSRWQRGLLDANDDVHRRISFQLTRAPASYVIPPLYHAPEARRPRRNCLTSLERIPQQGWRHAIQ